MSTALSNNAKSFLAWYLTHLATSPLRTKACTSGVLSGFQELTAQKLSGAKQLDKRVIQMAAYGKLLWIKFVWGVLYTHMAW